MRDADITNRRESTSSGLSSQAEIPEGPPFSPEQEGYTLLESGNTTDDDSESNSQNEDDLVAHPSDDIKASETARRSLSSGGVSRTFPSEVDESSPALLWNAPWSEGDKRIPLPEEKASEIKACLRDFQLPESNLPTWAKHIPEEVWKERLLQRLKSK